MRARGGCSDEYCACAVLLVIVEVEIDSGGGGGGGDDYIAARCWSIDPARDIGLRGVRDGHAKDVRRQHFYPLADSNFTL